MFSNYQRGVLPSFPFGDTTNGMRLGLILFLTCVLSSCSRDGEPPRYPDRPGAECTRTKACEQGQVCHYGPYARCGELGTKGACFPRPQNCTQDQSPVCGCDGRTYINVCVAHSHGVSPAGSGRCAAAAPTPPPAPPPPPQPTGACGPGTNTRCPAGMFCKFTEAQSCGEAQEAGTGQCTIKPTVCTEEWNTVCGCDGRNYSNDCVAHSHGASIRQRGLCEKPEDSTGDAGSTCGGSQDAECSKGLFCDYSVEAGCGTDEQTGTCQPRPERCFPDYRPVCGCDGMTYPNRCSASAAGVSVKQEGSCPPVAI